MRIDITAPEGNTLVALGIVTRSLRRIGVDTAEIDKLCTAVMNAESPADARAIMEEATHGAITFFDPRIED